MIFENEIYFLKEIGVEEGGVCMSSVLGHEMRSVWREGLTVEQHNVQASAFGHNVSVYV